MKAMRTLVVSLLFVVGVAVWLYPRLPAVVPTHWDAHGQADGWLPRFWAVAIWPLVMIGIAVLTVVLPVISPRRFEIASFARTYGVLMLAIQAFLLVVGVCAMLAGAGYAVPIPPVGMLAIGALLIVLGNYMGKLRKNFFIGIRTPWTLASARCGNTHTAWRAGCSCWRESSSRSQAWPAADRNG
ncbi:MAG TPA: DUF1648 domain-containing protein [Rhodanobacteraceae bacterium]|nr:DUF1648 domain-containing protein [Rhodanobacteraceae bacterium]